ncbi:reverse transcriptase [Tanacetum coccineum]
MYVMNLFLLPDVLIDEIHRAFNRFWWGHGNKENPIRWASWESMCISKYRGGLGFRHMKGFNKALLAKKGWRLITMEGPLPVRILKARICEDDWLQGYKTLHHHLPNSEYNVVNDLLDSTTQGWNHALLLQLFSRQIATRISCVHTNPVECDFLYWDASPNGAFTCKSAYWIATQSIDCLQEPQHERKYLKAVWLANVPSQVKIFVWRACMNLVPTISNLVTRRLVPNYLNCVHCSTRMEDIRHALFLCDWVRDIWAAMKLSDLTNKVVDISIEEMLGATKETPRHALVRAWSGPTDGVIKINCDAGVLGNDGVSGLGFVMRCHNGLVLVAGSRWVAFATSVFEAEAKAILWAIQVAQAKGYAKVVLETDSSIPVDAFKHNKVLYHIRA